MRHYRGDRLIREVDLYDFLLHGLRSQDERLAPGDTLLVPPAGAEVAVFGSVKRPAIYELKGDETLASLLEDAGGATVAAALNHITIDRIQANRQRETVSLDAGPEIGGDSVDSRIASFKVKDGDRIHVAPILPYSERAVYVEGHVIRPGKYPYRDGMRLSDVLTSYQDLLPEPSRQGEIVRLVAPDLHVETIQFAVADVLIGNSNFALTPFDTIRVYGRYEVDSPQVTIRGEVLKPGVYSLSEGMTAASLVRMAGGFKRDALLDNADLTSYTVVDGSKVVSERSSIPIGVAAAGRDAHADVALKSGDILTIHQISGWSDIGASVKVNGEVTYPGSYGLQEGERLSSVLRRAGGLRATAYPDGAVLIRLQVKQLEEKSREELIRQIETTSVSARLAPSLSGQDETAFIQAASQQQTEVLQRLRNEPVSGRLVIHMSSDIGQWANTSADIELRSGDMLVIPKRPGFVLVSGQVYNSSAITFAPGKTAGWYLQQAGGANQVANHKEIFIVRADGSVVGKQSGGMFSGGVLSTRLNAGDVIVVPQKIIGGSYVVAKSSHCRADHFFAGYHGCCRGCAMTPPRTQIAEAQHTPPVLSPNWVVNLGTLFDHRRFLARAGGFALILSILLAFLLPKRYESTARIMPPENAGSGSAMLAALAGRAGGGLSGLGGLAGSLLGSRSSSVLFVELLQSRSVADDIIDRFHLREVYGKRYRIDAVKFLAKRTSVTEDKKSGVVTITVTDTDPELSRAIAQAYLEELNSVVTRANTSSARQERQFIEQRLVSVRTELQEAEMALSAFSSTNTTLDIKEQTHAMVDAASRLQAQKIVGDSELASLSQIYGDDNVRVKAARARVAELQHAIQQMSGSSNAIGGDDAGEEYPSLRQLPRLAVPYANLYRRVRIEETVYELLSQQYEMARIAEAKDTPIVSVIDAPLVAEKKSFPPRLTLILALTSAALLAASAYVLVWDWWLQVDPEDARKRLQRKVSGSRFRRAIDE